MRRAADGEGDDVVVQEQGEAGLGSALSAIGDRWSLLVVSALVSGPRRFNELQESLGGIATNILSQRLKSLEALGVVMATPYSERPARFAYGLTASGMELAAAARLLAHWGAQHAGNAGEGPVHDACGSTLEARWYCPTCARVVEEEEHWDDEFI